MAAEESLARLSESESGYRMSTGLCGVHRNTVISTAASIRIETVRTALGSETRSVSKAEHSEAKLELTESEVKN